MTLACKELEGMSTSTFENGGNAHTIYKATLWELICFKALNPMPFTLEELTMESVSNMDEEVSDNNAIEYAR